MALSDEPSAAPTSPAAPGPASPADGRDAGRLRLLAELVERLNRAESRQEALDAALDGMLALLGTDRASILLFGDDDRVHFAAWRGLSDGYRAAVDGHSPWRREDGHAQPMLVPDVAASDLEAELKRTILDEGVRALAFFPLARRDQLLGKFMVYCDRARQATAEEVDLGKVVALHLSAALGRILDHEELQRREEHYRALIENSSDLIVLLDRHGLVSYESPAIEELAGYRPGERLGRSPFELIHPDDHPRATEALARLLHDPEFHDLVEFRVRHRDGGVRHLEIRGRNLLAHPAVRSLVLNIRDVTERYRAEEALRASEERYRALFEESRDPIYISTPAGRLLDVNPAGVRFFGFDSRADLLARDAHELYWEPAQRERFVSRVAADGFVTDLEVDLRTRDGGRRRVLETATAVRDGAGAVVAFRGTLRDVTGQRDLEEQLRQAQKMEAVGRLAGGVAHDFNNLLTAINGYSELLLRRFPPEDPARREAEEIHRSGRRAAELTRQLLALSRRQVLSPRTLDLNRALADMERLLRRVLGEDLELTLALGAGPATVRCDPGQLEQVVLNLAVNARDAMPAGGRLELATRNVHLGPAEARRRVDAHAGDHVELTVSDTGVGMPADVLEHVFEPFFTTKERGKGTGLGLSTVYGIVRQSGGQIEVTSRPGEGTTFRVLFPLADGIPIVEDRRVADASPPPGRETVLLVEDERSVRQLLASALRAAGYRVLEASEGEEARAVAAGHDGGIELLVTDLVMPRLGGLELATALAARHPRLRVVFISGYADRLGSAALPAPLARAPFLQKPFPTGELVRLARAVLDAAAEPPGGPGTHQPREEP